MDLSTSRSSSSTGPTEGDYVPAMFTNEEKVQEEPPAQAPVMLQNVSDVEKQLKYRSVQPYQIYEIRMGSPKQIWHHLMWAGMESTVICSPASITSLLGMNERITTTHTIFGILAAIRIYYRLYFMGTLSAPKESVSKEDGGDGDDDDADEDGGRNKSFKFAEEDEDNFVFLMPPLKDNQILPVEERRCFYGDYERAYKACQFEMEAALKCDTLDTQRVMYLQANERFIAKMLYLDRLTCRRRANLPVARRAERQEAFDQNFAQILTRVLLPPVATTFQEEQMIKRLKSDCDDFNKGMAQWSVNNHMMDGLIEKAKTEQKERPYTNEEWDRLQKFAIDSGFIGVNSNNIKDIAELRPFDSLTPEERKRIRDEAIQSQQERWKADQAEEVARMKAIEAMEAGTATEEMAEL